MRKGQPESVLRHSARNARLSRSTRLMAALSPAASCAACAFTFLATSGCHRFEPAAVFILAGQSNMVGQGLTADLPDSLRRAPPNVRFVLDGSVSGLGAGRTFGPEVTFAHEIARRWPDREIILVKFAVGGTSLLAWAPDWDSASAAITQNAGAGALYTRLLKHIAEADLPAGAEYAAVLWVQGERDARYPEAAQQYEANLVALIRQLRADLDVHRLPFFTARVNPPSDRYPAVVHVRRAQEDVAGRVEGVVIVDADGLSKRNDGVHYDTGGILELGRRFATAYLNRAGASDR